MGEDLVKLPNGQLPRQTSLAICDIVADPTLNVREGIDPSTVERYIEDWESLPPPVVFDTPEGYLLADGFHRLEAARRLGLEAIVVELRAGTRQSAIEWALRANLQHGKPLTAGERRRAVIGWLRLHPDWANNRVAAVMGVSKNTVESVRQELERAGEIPRLDELEGADGKTYPRNIEQPVRANTQAPLAACEFDTLGAMNEDWGDGEDNADDTGGVRDFPDIPPPGAIDLSLTLLAQANSVRLPLADGSVHTVAFSPPYWGQRRYEGEQAFVWPSVTYAMPGGVVRIPGDSTCEHEWTDGLRAPGRDNRNGVGSEALGPGKRFNENLRDAGQRIAVEVCVRCGAMRCPLGFEPTVDAYVGHIVLLLREVRRVLRPDGVLWLNLGFSYYGGGQGPAGGAKQETVRGSDDPALARFKMRSDAVYKPKDLVPVPWLVAIAAQYDGWYLRSPVVWSKPTAMPYPATDRLALDYEHILLLSRSGAYYFDAEGIREPASTIPPTLPVDRRGYASGESVPYAHNSQQRHGNAITFSHVGRYKRTTWDPLGEAARVAEELHEQGYDLAQALRCALGLDGNGLYDQALLLTRSAHYFYDADAIREPLDERYAQRRLTPRSEHPKYGGMPAHRRPDYALRDEPAAEGHSLGRGKRTTWDPLDEACDFALELHEGGRDLAWALKFALGLDPEDDVAETDALWRVLTFQYHGAHYAAWPPALVARMIQAGSPPAVCARCGRPWQRVIERSIATYPAGGDPTLDTGRAGFNRPRPGPAARRLMSVPQAEIARYLIESADGRSDLCRERYGTKWDHWTRTDASGARLPTPEDWLDLKAFLGLDDRYDRAILPKNLQVREGQGNRTYREGTVIRKVWEQRDVRLLGWRSDCVCFDHALVPADGSGDALHPSCAVCGEAHTAPAVVLDVTAGSGTTVQVARILGRAGIGLDISREYLRDLARQRISQPAKIYCPPQVPPAICSRPLPENEAILGDVAAVLPGLPRSSVDLLFLDPPFNLGKSYGGDVDDDRDEACYWERLCFWLDLVIPLLRQGGSLVLHHIPKWALRASAYLENRGLDFRRWVAWESPTYQGSRRGFRPAHYAFVWFSNGDGWTFNPVWEAHPRCASCGDYSTDWGGKEELRAEQGQRMSDVWVMGRVKHTARKGRCFANELPLEVALRWVLALTDPGGYVFDPMIGSGTTAAACELTGRRWGGVEIVKRNLGVIRVKMLVARGAVEVVGDVSALSAERRVRLCKALEAAWGEAIRSRVEEEALLLDAGRRAAELD